jgi:hypothetical protein
MRTCLVTLAIGDAYRSQWETFCAAGWHAYCATHGYDLVAIFEPLDRSMRAQQRSPAWQKCLVLECEQTRGYDRVVWSDSDILIRPDAPAITYGIPLDKVGAVDGSRYPNSRAENVRLNQVEQSRARDVSTRVHLLRSAHPPYYHQDRSAPLDESIDAVVHTGVLVMSRDQHAPLLRHVYDAYDDPGPAYLNYEMGPLSYELIKRRAVCWIDQRFNASLPALILQDSTRRVGLPTHAERAAAVQRFYRENYFMHFCGMQALLPEIAPVMLGAALVDSG